MHKMFVRWCVVVWSLLLVRKIASNEVDDFKNGNQAFSSRIFQTLSTQETGNFLVSPLSAQIILALTREGAKGETYNQLTSGLYLSPAKTQTQLAVSQIMSTYNQDGVYKLRTANKLYIQNGFTIRPTFLNIATSVYKAGAQNVNFADSANTVNLINQWVENQTNNKIKNLLASSDVNSLTRLVLVNALYFFGNWSHQFEPQNTELKDFHVTSSNIKQVPTMGTVSFYNYYEDSYAQYLELPYLAPDQNISMTIILPKPGRRLACLNANKIFTRPNYSRSRVSVSLPKFTIETSINFIPLLQQLGITDLFTGSADLSGIAGNPGDLAVGGVIQKTFINVTEAGTEAAAATAVQATKNSPLEDYSVECDHPFIFFISVDEIVVMAGQVSDPS